MDINYIILAHKNPEQIKRLVRRLSDFNVFFYIHIDKSVDIIPFINQFENFENVFFIENHKRQNGTWGDIGIVKATINAIKKIILDSRKGYIVLLSGQDYPIQSNDNIFTFLNKSYGLNYIDFFPIPFQYWHNQGIDRLNSYKINLSNRREHFIQIYSVFDKEFYTRSHVKKIYALILNNKFLELVNAFKKRKFPKTLIPYGGSQWWTITTDVAEKIFIFLQENPNYLKYHKYSLLPDEMFFQSILLNLARKDDTIKIKNNSLTYTNWTRKGCTLPVTFQTNDLTELLECTNNDKFFARKFDVDLDEEIMNLLDKRVICD